VYLPRYRFSSNSKGAKIATITSERGLKTDAYNGPLTPTHQAVTITTNPETTIPCHNILVS